MALEFTRRLCVSVDAMGYSRGHDRAQATLQIELVDLLGTAGAAAGLNRPTWDRQGSGDGELALVPATEPEARVVDDFVRELTTGLFRRNYDRTDRLRLRLAMDHGLVRPAANGFAGHPVVAVSRLVNSQPVRRALAAAEHANLAVILSHRVYADLVIGGHTRLGPADFREVAVREKEFTGSGWLQVPGADVHRLHLDGCAPGPVEPDSVAPAAGGPGAAPGRRPHPAQAVVNEFAAAVDVRGGVIGIRNDR